jgi:hypothetical protein
MATKTIAEKPNGPVAAALLAGGIGSAVLGLVTLIYELNDQSSFAKSLAWYKPSGALTGKSGLGIIAFFAAWAILHFVWKDKQTDFNRIATIAFVLLAIGLLGTFPPVWHLFAGG